MKQYARIEGTTVMEVFNTDLDISSLFNEKLVWVQVPSKQVPLTLPCEYVNGVFKKTSEQLPVFTKEEIENNRLRYYADPIIGSDRYFCEAQSLIAAGVASDSEEVKLILSKGLDRKKEIQLLFPYPA